MYLVGGIALIALYLAALYACRARNGISHVLADTNNKAQVLVLGLTTLLCFGLAMIVHDIF